ncbi:hypothetical protein ACFV2N_02725 [Streptomyces sp. NPDC059680]|uniref:hypothetical protein n=1 Tax=Streptomyces sp. NPDC059680 TaxID=3346904 RepID=UPI0036C27A1B
MSYPPWSRLADGVQLRVAQGLPEALLEEMQGGRHDLVIATPAAPRPRRGVGAARRRGVSARRLAELGGRIAAHPQAGAYLCADLREVSLITYAEDLLNARRYSRTIFGRQLTATRA